MWHQECSPAWLRQLIHLDCTSIGKQHSQELSFCHWDGKWCDVTHRHMAKVFAPTDAAGWPHPYCSLGRVLGSQSFPQSMPRSMLEAIRQTGMWSQLCTLEDQCQSFISVYGTSTDLALYSCSRRAPGTQLNCDTKGKKEEKKKKRISRNWFCSI